MNLPNLVEGQAYWPHLAIPNWNMNKTSTFYEVNLAVSDDIFKMFKDAGFSHFFLNEPGTKTFTPDPVIKFATFATNQDGTVIDPPPFSNKDGKAMYKTSNGFADAPDESTDRGSNGQPLRATAKDFRIGNGSTLAIEFEKYEYGKVNKVVRPKLKGVRVIDLIEYEHADSQPQPAFAS